MASPVAAVLLGPRGVGGAEAAGRRAAQGALGACMQLAPTALWPLVQEALGRLLDRWGGAWGTGGGLGDGGRSPGDSGEARGRGTQGAAAQSAGAPTAERFLFLYFCIFLYS